MTLKKAWSLGQGRWSPLCATASATNRTPASHALIPCAIHVENQSRRSCITWERSMEAMLINVVQSFSQLHNFKWILFAAEIPRWNAEKFSTQSPVPPLLCTSEERQKIKSFLFHIQDHTTSLCMECSQNVFHNLQWAIVSFTGFQKQTGNLAMAQISYKRVLCYLCYKLKFHFHTPREANCGSSNKNVPAVTWQLSESHLPTKPSFEETSVVKRTWQK